MRRPSRPTLRRYAVLAALLSSLAVLVPDAGTAATQAVLVKYQHAEGVALEDDMVWILGVGSDARPGEDMTRTRGDALQLVGMNTRTGAATSIGIPRDSYVSIPGFGSDRINASLAYGGPQLLGETVGELTGIEPDYVLVTRFPYFEQMVDDIGGITVRNPTAFADDNLKDNGFPAGRIRLDGYDAMAFSRIRHDLPGGDFDRSANQQRVLAGIQARIAQRVDQPGFIDRGVLTVLEHTDTDLSPAELFRLAHVVAQVRPGRITGCVVHGSFADVGGASVVLPYTADARRYGDDARKDAVISRC
ncbi:LCP family protein [Nocardioides rubriscoriae]|uniref:LCP family protein n=1 Tax=Nocardioides rubriscoriae TaxID=642762 RepID=UPI001FECC20E|nr:LCP family protein [Nocardioides rubriscoriae]